MSKHPGPWAIIEVGGVLYLVDNGGHADHICEAITPDPETRAVLLHAAEMWEAIQVVASTAIDTPAYRHADKALCMLANKIEAEISKGKP